MLQRQIPATGEKLPAIGLGTWQTFDVGRESYENLSAVLDTFKSRGGKLIDSSPMYGKAESVVGALTSGKESEGFFFATKVWTEGKLSGIRQMEESFSRMKRKQMDLMQIHNLLDWKTHLHTLREWKEEGRIRYIGITHYTDAMHEALVKVLTTEKIDFVQFNYSISSRHAEKRLLPAAADHGVATLINRPFGEGQLFRKVQGKPLPGWATAQGFTSWSVFFLSWILSHPAVTCVIPATSSAQHAYENLEAGYLQLPDEALREKMSRYIEAM